MHVQARRWGWICVAASGAFVALAVTVWIAGVPTFERDMYYAVTAAIPKIDLFRWITRLGSESILFPASVILIVLLPRQFLRYWWMWAAVMLIVSGLEGLGKHVVGRPRPETLRPGFPSGHTSAAAAFYLMAAYLSQGAVRGGLAKWAVYGVAGFFIGLVGLSRMALRVHWPLDVLGGVTLGVAVFAAAAWWQNRHPDAWRPLASVPTAWCDAIYRWQNLIQLALVVVVVVRPPMAEDDSLLDLGFDVSGGIGIAAGLLVRLWAAGHAEPRPAFRGSLPTRFYATGPYAHMRQPLAFSTLLTGLGFALLAESALGLVLIPAVLITMYRITIPLEEAYLAARLGTQYAHYCQRVPRFPSLTGAILAGASATHFGAPVLVWRSITRELPAIATAMALIGLAEAHEFFPHLLR